jgi:hypothetical protein
MDSMSARPEAPLDSLVSASARFSRRTAEPTGLGGITLFARTLAFISLRIQSRASVSETKPWISWLAPWLGGSDNNIPTAPIFQGQGFVFWVRIVRHRKIPQTKALRCNRGYVIHRSLVHNKSTLTGFRAIDRFGKYSGGQPVRKSIGRSLRVWRRKPEGMVSALVRSLRRPDVYRTGHALVRVRVRV